MPMIPLGEWLPDQPDFQNPGSSVMTNVLPRTASSYGPAPQASATTGALGARCQGAAFVRDAASNVLGFAGDATKLYRLSAGSSSWSDVSKGGGYTIATDERWNFTQYGERIIATDFADAIQSYVMGSSALFADLAAAAPKARYMAIVKDWLMVANTYDATNGSCPQRIWWAAIDDPTNWPTPGTATAAQLQSDYNDLAGDGGWNQGIVGTLSSADVAVIQEKTIFRGMYVGPPVIFAFTKVEAARGTPAPGSIVVVGGIVYYLADDGFYAFDGLQSVPIGREKIDRTFWSEVATSYLYRITSAVDPVNKIIYWAYPGPQSSAGAPNRILAFNYDVGRWSRLEQDTEIMVRALATGYTLEQLDAFGTLETLPFSLDSRAWTGGALNLACFDTSHKLSLFAGSPLAATMDSSEANLNDKRLTHLSRVWPMVDTGSAQITIGSRNRLADAVSWGSAVSMTSTTGSCPVRNTAVYQRARITIPAGTSWTHAQGIQVDARKAGAR
jgi:hypothetical protein